jgi:hypothetical protein
MERTMLQRQFQIINLFVFISVLAFGQTTLKPAVAESTFTLNYEKNLSKLYMEFSMSYTAAQQKKDTAKQTIFEKHFGKEMNQEQSNSITVTEIRSLLMNLIDKDPDLKLEPSFPKDVLMIIDLIDDESKREKARQIYINENQDKLIGSGQNVEYQSREKDFTKKIKLTYYCRIRVSKNTRLPIPALSILYDEHTFQTKPFTISFKIN